MHCSSFEIEGSRLDGGEVLVAITALVTEGRIPCKSNSKSRGFYEGPHCQLSKASQDHNCDAADPVCSEYEKVRLQVLELWQKGIPLCVDVLLTAGCACADEGSENCSSGASEPIQSGFLMEQWLINISHRRTYEKSHVNLPQLTNAIRSQLYFSQISAWLSMQDEGTGMKISKNNINYRVTILGETFETSQFITKAVKHDFPFTDIGGGLSLQMSLLSLPRMSEIPNIKCPTCEPVLSIEFDKIKIESKDIESRKLLVDDRMHTICNLKGKHRCEDFDEFDCGLKKEQRFSKFKRVCHTNNLDYGNCQPSTSKGFVKPKLSLDIAKADVYRQVEVACHSNYANINKANHIQVESSVNANEKRNLSPNVEQHVKNPKLDLTLSSEEVAEVTDVSRPQTATNSETINQADLNKHQSKGDILLDAILRSCRSSASDNVLCDKQSSTNSFLPWEHIDLKHKSDEHDDKQEKKAKCDLKCVQKFGPSCPSLSANAIKSESDTNNSLCDNLSESDIFSIKDKAKFNIYIDKHCDSPIPKMKHKKIRDISNLDRTHSSPYKYKARQKITFEDDDETIKPVPFLDEDLENDVELLDLNSHLQREHRKYERELSSLAGLEIPSALDQAKFRKSLDNATSMVFHSRTGLPLTSSPAPIRRGKSCFDFDSSINSVSAIGNALFSLASDDDSESDGSIVSPCSPDFFLVPKRDMLPIKYYRRGHPNNLLGTFEESVLNGRLEPVSTVQGFSAELGASGSFVPKHLVVPVTVFFYNLGDNDKVSSPYLGHINLGRKGYQVPKSGTVQVTLFNPLGTVVKMFVIMYDLSNMPPSSQTFIRQRTLYMPTNYHDENLAWGPKWLRYLIHLRFMSSKSGRIYLHSDIRMIIFCKTDLDTATAHGIDMSYELRSFTHMPTNPRYSPRK